MTQEKLELPIPPKGNKFQLYGIFLFFITLGLIGILGLGNMLLPLTFSFFLSYLLFPLLWALEKRLLKREIAILLVFFLCTLLFILFFFLLLPPFFREVRQLVHELPHLLSGTLIQIDSSLQKWDIHLPWEGGSLVETFKKYSSHLSLGSLKALTDFLRGPLANIMTGFLAVFNLFIIPLFTFHILRDYEKILRTLRSFIPLKWHSPADQFFADFDTILSGHIRGQLMVGFLLGILYTIGLSLVGLKFSITIGLISGFLNIIPYLGTLIGFTLAIFMTLSEFSLGFILKISLVFIIVQTLEGTLITPKVVGDKVGLGPLATLLGLIVGGNLGGILGLMVAVPVTAILKIIVGRVVNQYQTSSFYHQK